jgi:hypothetical protein
VGELAVAFAWAVSIETRLWHIGRHEEHTMQSHRAVLIVGIMLLGMVTSSLLQNHTQAISNPRGTGHVADQAAAMPDVASRDALSTLIFLTGQ